MLQKTFPTYEQLLLPLPIWNPKAWYYGLMNLSLKTIGKLSRGIQIGFQYGFDSGVMLEYVYKNQPSGITPLGTLIDWFYLNSQGWRGIRSRSQLMKTTLRRVLQSYQRQNIPCHLLDVACGGGRYDLEVLQEFEQELGNNAIAWAEVAGFENFQVQMESNGIFGVVTAEKHI